MLGENIKSPQTALESFPDVPPCHPKLWWERHWRNRKSAYPTSSHRLPTESWTHLTHACVFRSNGQLFNFDSHGVRTGLKTLRFSSAIQLFVIYDSTSSELITINGSVFCMSWNTLGIPRSQGLQSSIRLMILSMKSTTCMVSAMLLITARVSIPFVLLVHT